MGQYREYCKCFSGYKGIQCERRMCPSGRSWVDYPTANDTAHAKEAVCSDMGVCTESTGMYLSLLSIYRSLFYSILFLFLFYSNLFMYISYHLSYPILFYLIFYRSLSCVVSCILSIYLSIYYPSFN